MLRNESNRLAAMVQDLQGNLKQTVAQSPPPELFSNVINQNEVSVV